MLYLLFSLSLSRFNCDSWPYFTYCYLELVMFWWQTVLIWNVNPIDIYLLTFLQFPSKKSSSTMNNEHVRVECVYENWFFSGAAPQAKKEVALLHFFGQSALRCGPPPMTKIQPYSSKDKLLIVDLCQRCGSFSFSRSCTSSVLSFFLWFLILVILWYS